jgi:hypothetical protein
VVIFAFLFGLSMDYEVFILSRMREEYDRTGEHIGGCHHRHRSDRPARHLRGADPLLRVLCAASSPGTDIKVIGTALGVGILLDATIVRALLVPALGVAVRPLELVAARNPAAARSSCSSLWMRCTWRRFGWLGSRATRDRCCTVTPRCASPSTPRPASSWIRSRPGLLKACVRSALTAATRGPFT